MESIAVSSSEADTSHTTSAEIVDTAVQGSTAPTVVHVSIPNQPVQVQSVIQAAPSVIQTATGQTIQAIQVATVVSDGDGTSADEDAETNRKRRELLARRPSYRKILNELSATDQPQVITVSAKVEADESNGSQTSGAEEVESSALSSASTSSATAVQYAGAAGVTVVPAGAIQLAGHPDSSGLQTLTMTNDSVKSSATQGATIVQYAQGPDGQFFIPGNVQYQIAPTTLPQGVVMATGGTTIASPQNVPEEASRKRELRLLKNREAARECRRKKKEYVKCLENRVAVLENQNKTLIEELKSLKELYCQKEAQS